MADDGSAAHVAIATRGDVPSWPPHTTGPRVLVEGHTGWRAQDAAARRGLEVLVCPGPNARAHGCPVLEGGTCPLVDAADAVVVSLPSGDERMRQLVRAHRSRHPAMPVVVEARHDAPTAGETARVAPGAPDDEIVDLLFGVLGRRPQPRPGGDDAAMQHDGTADDRADHDRPGGDDAGSPS
jgi:hypothetical protein